MIVGPSFIYFGWNRMGERWGGGNDLLIGTLGPCVTRGTRRAPRVADWTGEKERPPSFLGPISFSSSSSWRWPASGKSCFSDVPPFSVNWDMRIQRMLQLGGQKQIERARLEPSGVGKDNCVDYYSFENENIKLKFVLCSHMERSALPKTDRWNLDEDLLIFVRRTA